MTLFSLLAIQRRKLKASLRVRCPSSTECTLLGCRLRADAPKRSCLVIICLSEHGPLRFAPGFHVGVMQEATSRASELEAAYDTLQHVSGRNQIEVAVAGLLTMFFYNSCSWAPLAAAACRKLTADCMSLPRLCAGVTYDSDKHECLTNTYARQPHISLARSMFDRPDCAIWDACSTMRLTCSLLCGSFWVATPHCKTEPATSHPRFRSWKPSGRHLTRACGDPDSHIAAHHQK